MQDPHILPGRPLRSLLEQHVVGHAEATAGKEIGLVTIIAERSRLANQPVDDVPIVHAVLASTPQPRHDLHLLLAVPDLDPLGIQAGLDPLADQSATHRVDIAFDTDGAARLHPHPQPLAGFQTMRRQRSQQGSLLGQAVVATGVALSQHLSQEPLVRLAADKIATAPQQQTLLQGSLELVMALLAVAILMGLASVDRLPGQAVVAQQSLVASLEDLGVGPRLNRRGQPVGAMNQRHTAQLPQGVLQALAEALEALAKADRRRLPIGVGEHKVVDQVREGMTGERDAQVVAVGEVGGGQPPGMMNLGEEDLLGRSLLRPPSLDATLERPHLAIGESARILPLQSLKEGLGFQAGVESQLFFQLRPDLGKRIGPCSPGVLHAYLAWQLTQPPVFACGLLIHAGPGRSLALGPVEAFQAKEATNVLIGDRHLEPPCKGDSR
jgi:hypothetical protein